MDTKHGLNIFVNARCEKATCPNILLVCGRLVQVWWPVFRLLPSRPVALPLSQDAGCGASAMMPGGRLRLTSDGAGRVLMQSVHPEGGKLAFFSGTSAGGFSWFELCDESARAFAALEQLESAESVMRRKFRCVQEPVATWRLPPPEAEWLTAEAYAAAGARHLPGEICDPETESGPLLHPHGRRRLNPWTEFQDRKSVV